METRWYYQAPDGSTGGPLPTPVVLKALLDGQLPPDVQLCEEGKGSWAPPRDLQAFKLASRVVRASRGAAASAEPASHQPEAPAYPAPQSLPRAPAAAPLPPSRAVPAPMPLSRAAPPPVPPPHRPAAAALPPMPAPLPPPRSMPAAMQPPPAAAIAPPPEDDDEDEMKTIMVTSSAASSMRGYPGAPGPMPVATVPGLPAPAQPPRFAPAPPPAAASPADDDDDEELKTRVATSPETDVDMPYGFGGMPSPLGGPMPSPLGGPMPSPLGGPMPSPLGGPMPSPLGGPMPSPIGAAPVPPARAAAPKAAPPPVPPRRAPVQTLMGMPSPAAPPPVRQPPAPIEEDDDSEDLKTRVASPDDAPMVFRPPVPLSPVPHPDQDAGEDHRAADEPVVPKVVVSERPEPIPASAGSPPNFDHGLDAASKRAWPAPKLIPPPPKKVTIDEGPLESAGDRITDPGARITAPPQQPTIRRMQAMQPTMKLTPIKPPGPSKALLLLIAGGAALAAFLVALVIVVLMRR